MTRTGISWCQRCVTCTEKQKRERDREKIKVKGSRKWLDRVFFSIVSRLIFVYSIATRELFGGFLRAKAANAFSSS